MSRRIPKDTWRERVARVLKTGDWMDAHDVSSALTSSDEIGYTISNGGASSVLSDMNRHDDVVRQSVSRGQIQYEYRLREDAVIE
ncbi:hypothetical protein SAMN04489842_1456 [Natronobacterium texcoconense]|uniref:Uncharacterized protein n=1 Tax=Natronobacterium texcoconense TaxID=1095778 RepID=A0A1H1CM33_NATTX|nr:hypothetical protein SAMN04489842_1456 [Natronobacterium texcoconense]